jgi:ketopantoate reductase
MNLIIGTGSIGSVLACFLSGMGSPISWLVPKTEYKKFSSSEPLQVTFPHGYQLTKSTPHICTEIDLRGVQRLIIAEEFDLTKQILDALPLDFYRRITILPCVSSIEQAAELCQRYAPIQIRPLVVMFDAARKSTKHIQLITRPRVMSQALASDISSAFYLMGMGVHHTNPSVYWGNVFLHCADPLAALTGMPYRDLILHPQLRNLSLTIFSESVRILNQLNMPLIFPDGGRIHYPVIHSLLKFWPKYSWILIKNIHGTHDKARPAITEKLHQGNTDRVQAVNGALVKLADTFKIPAPYNQRLVELCEEFAQTPEPEFLTIETLHNRVMGGSFLA